MKTSVKKITFLAPCEVGSEFEEPGGKTSTKNSEEYSSGHLGIVRTSSLSIEIVRPC